MFPFQGILCNFIRFFFRVVSCVWVPVRWLWSCMDVYVMTFDFNQDTQRLTGSCCASEESVGDV